MEINRINSNTKYISKISFDDYSSVNDILVSYYLPIIKAEAFSLYSALVLDARNQMINTIFVSIERLVSMINLSIEKIEDSISRLEIVNLLEVYVKNDDEIVFKLIKPLTPEQFNNSEQFTDLLKSSAGGENLNINNKLFHSLKANEVTGESITKTKDLSIMIENPKTSLNVNFDFETIKNILNAKNIDWSFIWNEELEQKLLNVMIIYRVTPFDIAIEIIKEIETKNFDPNNLIEKIRNDFIKNDDISSIVSVGENTTEIKLDFMSQLKVRDFLIHKLNRGPTPSEEEMITKLIDSYGLSDYQINILIDYSIIVNDGAINKNYIFKIADTILKEGINTPEKLIQHLKVSYKLKTKNKTVNLSHLKKPMEDKPIF